MKLNMVFFAKINKKKIIMYIHMDKKDTHTL